MKDLVREKAGYAGTDQNLITRTDILAALRIGDPKDLLPCEPALVDVGSVLEREQLASAMSLIPSMSKPLLLHAAGGVGKTVFLDSLATKISEDHGVVFFDCFGGGAYRSPEDARHLPKRGLILRDPHEFINSFLTYQWVMVLNTQGSLAEIDRKS